MYHQEIDSLVNELTKTQLNPTEHWILLVASRSAPKVNNVIEVLNYRRIDFVGAVFPAIIWNGKVHDIGFLSLKVKLKSKPVLIPELEEETLNQELENSISAEGMALPGASLIFIDGYYLNIENFINKTFNRYSNKIQFYGAGTGVQKGKEPSIFDNNGFYKNAVAYMMLDLNISVGIMHGYNRVAEPLLLTKSSQNILQEINYQNAFRIYQDILKHNFGIRIFSDDYYDTVKKYPIGIIKTGGEDLVREVVSITGKGEIICSGDIPVNDYMNLLNGEQLDFFQAADQAVKDSITNAYEPKLVLIFDCFSRSDMIKGAFQKEITRIYGITNELLEPESVFGAISMGQIVNGPDNTLIYYKKTVSAATFY